MRKSLDHLEEFRDTSPGPYCSSRSDGRNGRFHFRSPMGRLLAVICSDGSDWHELGLPGHPWEHVSVTLYLRNVCPVWEEMDFVRNQFWRPDELVLQFHVPHEVRVNNHSGCLHLWRPIGVVIPQPPSACV